jgi:hypothetical protein
MVSQLPLLRRRSGKSGSLLRASMDVVGPDLGRISILDNLIFCISLACSMFAPHRDINAYSGGGL